MTTHKVLLGVRSVVQSDCVAERFDRMSARLPVTSVAKAKARASASGTLGLAQGGQAGIVRMGQVECAQVGRLGQPPG